MAATQWIPGHHLGRTAIEIRKQATKNSQIVAIAFIALLACILPGCKSGRPPAFTTSYADSQVVGARSNGLLTEPEIGLVSYRETQDEDSDRNAIRDNREPVDSAEIENTSPLPQIAADPTGPAREPSQISLDEVLASVTQCYPEIEVAIAEIESAEGKIISSWGEFDSRFFADSISQPLGFYQNYRNGTGVARPLWGGGEVFGSYRIGDGDFEPWYGERETNEGGEFKAGFAVPLLKDRSIDQRRAAVGLATANRDQVTADVESRLLLIQRAATQAFWDWVASGQAVQVQEQLLDLAQRRVQQIKLRVQKGDLAKVAQIDNDRFIAKRQNNLIKARRLLEKSAIKLSLFLRDENCTPIIPAKDQLPVKFPESQRITSEQRETDISSALAVRPDFVALNAARRQAEIDLQYANNLVLPKLDVKGYAAQDVGGAASSKRDKTPFQMQLGVYAEVPIQRREARGKIQTAQAKINQIDAKTRFVTDKVRAEIQDAASAVNAAFDQIQQSQLNSDLARQSLALGRQLFDAGDIDLIELNIYENAVADAQLELLEAVFKYFFYRAVYETAKSGVAFDR